MSERWFSEQELGEMSRPTMERAIEAIEGGDLERAKQLCEAMKWESQFMHDLLVDGVAGLISFVKERLGDDGVEEAWFASLDDLAAAHADDGTRRLRDSRRRFAGGSVVVVAKAIVLHAAPAEMPGVHPGFTHEPDWR